MVWNMDIPGICGNYSIRVECKSNSGNYLGVAGNFRVNIYCPLRERVPACSFVDFAVNFLLPDSDVCLDSKAPNTTDKTNLRILVCTNLRRFRADHHNIVFDRNDCLAPRTGF